MVLPMLMSFGIKIVVIKKAMSKFATARGGSTMKHGVAVATPDYFLFFHIFDLNNYIYNISRSHIIGFSLGLAVYS